MDRKRAVNSGDSLEHFTRQYGDLIFDLCISLLNSSQKAQNAFRTILRRIHSKRKKERFSVYERSWVLRITCETLLSLREEREGSSQEKIRQEKIRMDTEESPTSKLEEFQLYFRRLEPEDQILLLLRDTFGIPYSEVSVAMALPEGSLKIRRQQALRTLEDWLWNRK